MKVPILTFNSNGMVSYDNLPFHQPKLNLLRSPCYLVLPTLSPLWPLKPIWPARTLSPTTHTTLISWSDDQEMMKYSPDLFGLFDCIRSHPHPVHRGCGLCPRWPVWSCSRALVCRTSGPAAPRRTESTSCLSASRPGSCHRDVFNKYC